MTLNKYIGLLLSFFLLLSLFAAPALADQDAPEFRYELSVDGKDTVEVNTGDIITVTLYLYRTDKDAPYTMYAMQDEIRYDSDFFELVEDGTVLYSGVQSSDIGLVDNHREFYMNFLSLVGGTQWETKTRVGTFQLRVIGTSGVTTLTNEDFLVSLPGGNGSYVCEANVLTVILTTECNVRFETNGGSKIADVTAIFGELLERPADPVREGKLFAGWYKDIHLTEEWDFANDTVTGNMTLYAKWENVPDVDPPKPTEPTGPIGPTEPTDPSEPGTDPKQECIICGGDNIPFAGVPLCWRCLLFLLILVLVVLYLIWRNSEKKRKSKRKTEQ